MTKSFRKKLQMLAHDCDEPQAEIFIRGSQMMMMMMMMMMMAMTNQKSQTNRSIFSFENRE
jgi:hypothetical protein